MAKSPCTGEKCPESGDRARRVAMRKRFFQRLGTDQPFRQLFEHLSDVYFFAKDARSRLMAASRPVVERLGRQDETEVIGRTDDEFFPPQIAASFVRDDRQVMQTGHPLIGRVEMWYSQPHVLDWFVTNKLPLRDSRGQIIGVMGTTQSYAERQKTLRPFSQITGVVEYIHTHRHGRITVSRLAKLACLSPRQLSRRFHELFGLSVQEFVMKTRIQRACDRLINSDETISSIAQDFGFCDQSAFTSQFRKQTGLTPHKYRSKYAVM